jgi:phage FluMu protein Com
MARYATTEKTVTCDRCECIFTKRESLTEYPSITCPKCKWSFYEYTSDIEITVRVRQGGVTPIRTFEATGEFSDG